jgi:hypothetical protein
MHPAEFSPLRRRPADFAGNGKFLPGVVGNYFQFS